MESRDRATAPQTNSQCFQHQKFEMVAVENSEKWSHFEQDGYYLSFCVSMKCESQ